MPIEKRVNAYNNLFMSILFGAAFTVAGGLIANGAVDWHNFPAQILVSTVVGFIVGMVIPGGKWGAILAGKVARPETLLFKLVMYAVILVVMLLFMCPILTLFIGYVIQGAPVTAVLPNSYSLFVPFFLIGIIIAPLTGSFIMKLSMKCAGMSDE